MILIILQFLGIGFLAGFIASTPLGPINMVIANKVLSDSSWSMHKFVAGVVIVDVSFAVFALWGFYEWMDQFARNDFIVGIGGVFIITIGIFGITNINAPKKTRLPGVGDFVKGVLLCSLNPGFFFYWVFVADRILISQRTPSLLFIGFFGVGVALGNMFWFYLFRYLLSKGSAQLGVNTIKLIRRTISVSLVGFGLFTIYNHFI